MPLPVDGSSAVHAAAIGPLVHRLLPLFTLAAVDGTTGTPAPTD
ncbi:MAG: hypothetical protein ACYCTH_05325 [Cellulomonas sp.]